jgi:hypothetical protein
MIQRAKLQEIAFEGAIYRGETEEDAARSAKEVVSYVLANLEVCQAYFHDSDVQVIVRKAAEYGWGLGGEL